MNEKNLIMENEKKRLAYYQDGKIYFDRRVERGFYFFLTMLVLVWGLLEKLGVVV